MRYSQDLPLEEKQRLDQIHLKQGGVNPYGTDLNNENSGLNSMFPPRDKIGHHMVLKPSVTKSPAELMEWARNERMNRRQKSPEEMAYYTNIDETQGNPTVKDPASELQRLPSLIGQPMAQPPSSSWLQETYGHLDSSRPMPSRPMQWPDRGGFRPDFTPRPNEPPAPNFVSDISTQPTTMPRPSGGPFGGGGKGGNFLGRFERLLDGLEGLVGKLGGSGGTSESPFPTGDGGGLSEVIQTPFTPTQDY